MTFSLEKPLAFVKAIPLKKLILGGVALVAVVAGLIAWAMLRNTGPGPGFASGNGRIEATEVDVATKLAGRVDAILVNEGDFVSIGQPLAKMQVQVLDAQRDEASAKHQQALTAVVAAEAQVAVRASDKVAAQALVIQRESERDAAQLRSMRSETLSQEGASSVQERDDDRARTRSAQAAVGAAQKAGHHRLGRAFGHLGYGGGRGLDFDHGRWGNQQQHRMHQRVVQHGLQALAVALGPGVADDIHRVVD